MKIILLNFLKYALRQMARLTIWRFKPDIIAVTGSVGKTSAKEAIYAVLRTYKRARRTMGNLNNELGMPLTILGDFSDEKLKLISRGELIGKNKFKKIFFWTRVIIFSIVRLFNPHKSAYPEILILEYGADRPGDISYLLKIAKPKIGVITAIGETPVHMEFYENAQAVAKEKAKIIDDLSSSGFAVLNFDDDVVMEIKDRTRAKIMTFGFEEFSERKPDIKISNFENKYEDNNPTGISFKLEYNGSFVPMVLDNVFGKSRAYAAAAGVAIGLIYDLNLVEAAEYLSNNYEPMKGRMNLTKGIKNIYIIDDSYNASPLSMKQALETLRDLKAERKIAVLGDMLELGEYSEKAHKTTGKLAAEMVSVLITVGVGGKIIAKAAINNGLSEDKVLSFDSSKEAKEAIKKIIKKNDLILIKASRAIGLDVIVNDLKK